MSKQRFTKQPVYTMFDNFQFSLIPQHCDHSFRSSIPFSLTSLSLETKLRLTASLKLDFKVEDGSV